MLLAVIAWIVLAIGAGAVATAKGRSGGGYFLLSLFLPLIDFLIAVGMPSLMYIDQNGVRRRMTIENNTVPEPPAERALRIVVVSGMVIAIIVAAIMIATQRPPAQTLASSLDWKERGFRCRLSAPDIAVVANFCT
jgi:hypothetical protein